MPPGSTFQPAEAGLTCTDEKIRNGMQMVSCTGERLTSYNLKVCNPACAAAAPLTANATPRQVAVGPCPPQTRDASSSRWILGRVNNSDSKVFAKHPESARLWNESVTRKSGSKVWRLSSPR
jgi:hypothetical protein